MFKVFGLLVAISTLTWGVCAEAKESAITGKILFLDTRVQGVWHLRTDRSGKEAEYEKGLLAYRSLRGARVRAMEQRLTTVPINLKCLPGLSEIGRASVQKDGSFSVLWKRTKACGDNVRLFLLIELAFCNTAEDDTVNRCFEVQDPGRIVHSIAWPATDIAKMLSPEGWIATRAVGDIIFQGASVRQPSDVKAKAANYFASLYDSTYVHYAEHGLVQSIDRDGPIILRFPMKRKKAAGCWTTDAAINCKMPPDGEWTAAKAVFHEYGHVMMNQAFGGRSIPCGSCPGGQYAATRPTASGSKPETGKINDRPTSWGIATFEYPTVAFKEGFANFVARVTSDTCASEAFDLNVNATVHSVPGVPGNSGVHFVGNVTRALCDWIDATVDIDTDRPGTKDDVQVAWADVYTALILLYRSKPRTHWDGGMNFCDLVRFYVSDLNANEADLRNRMTSMTKLNGIDCGL